MRKFILLALLIFLSSCSAFQYRDKEYLKAKSTPPLRIPPGLSSSTIQSHYPIPTRNDSEKSKEVNLLPPDMADAK